MNRAPLLLLALLLIVPACRERDVDRPSESAGNVAGHADAPADGTVSTAGARATPAAVDTPPTTGKPPATTPLAAVAVVVTGATEEQRNWRIHSADLGPCAKSRQSR